MWFWLIFAALANRSLLPSLAEPLVGNDLQEDVPDDAMYLYMQERSLKEPKEADDIETRRRSPLDMNFMRFGKRDYFPPITHYYDLKDLDYNDEFNKPLKDFVRARRDSGDKKNKGKDYTNFVRFGRNFYENLGKDARFGKRRDYTDFIRFGRTPLNPLSDVYREDKRQHTNTMRFGKKSTGFMRFG